MTSWNYYNEIDKYAADWLRNLIAAGLIAPGEVDTRSIEDVHPADLQDFTQCHFFAGIGGWSIALRAAGWADDRPVWTGSCPCQSFSTAGKGAGFADERHLWPNFYHLIREHQEWCRQQKRRAPIILGEQVASKDADAWIDLVCADLEAVGNAFAAVPFPSAGVGAPHIRDRNYWLAYPDSSAGRKGSAHLRGRSARGDAQPRSGLGSSGMSRGLGHPDYARLEGYAGHGGAARWQGQERPVAEAGISLRLADRDSDRCAPHAERGLRDGQHHSEPCSGDGRLDDAVGIGFASSGKHYGGDDRVVSGAADQICQLDDGTRPRPVNGRWNDADWLFCRDAKWRPVEAGTFPLADGLPRSVGSGGAWLERLAGVAGLDNASLARAKGYRVGALRGYGNAINPEQAREFIESVMHVLATE